MAGVTFIDNAIDKSIATTGIFQDIDISSETGGDTAIGAIFTIQNTAGSGYDYALRKNGSSDNIYSEVRAGSSTVALIGLDLNEVSEMKIWAASVDLYLTAYITGGAVFFTNAIDVSTATDEFVFGVIVLESSANRDLFPGAGQIERWNLFLAPSTNGGGSTEEGAASVAMSWSWIGAYKWPIGGVSIKP
jgi:hypothetical protein